MKKNFLAATLLLVLAGSFTAVSAQAKRLWTSPKAGIWRVKATDEEKEVWRGRLTLARKSNGKYRGYFYWISSDKTTSGREYFNGSFDRKTGKLRLKAYAVKNIKGELGIGNYLASVNKRGRNIPNGKWSGDESIPGIWSAVWLKAR